MFALQKTINFSKKNSLQIFFSKKFPHTPYKVQHVRFRFIECKILTNSSLQKIWNDSLDSFNLILRLDCANISRVNCPNLAILAILNLHNLQKKTSQVKLIIFEI